MRHLKILSFTLMLSILGLLPAFATDVTGTINFGSASGSTNVNAASVTGDDSQGNTWTITTAGTTSFTPNASYAQIGSGNKPASSITFTTTLDNDVDISAFSAKFGGFNGTAGTVTLKVDDETVGTGSLSASTDVTVNKSGTTAVTGSVLTVTVTGISKGVKAYYISYTYDGGGDPDPVLQSIAISGSPTTTTYEAGDIFDVAGLVVTGAYDKGSPATITDGITWEVRTNSTSEAVALASYTLTASQTALQVRATVGEISSAWTDVTSLTVNEHIITPGKYDITLANAFWGTSGTGASAGHTASGTKNDITISIAGTSGTQNYINDSETRVYGSHTITFSVPSGYVLKEITGLGSSSKSDISVATGSTGSINTRVWTGSTNSVTFTVNGRTDFTTVSVTYTVYVPVTACATPAFSPAEGEYEGTQSVTISCETDGASVYYTTNGDAPSSSSTLYEGAISVTTTTTIKAIAIKEGLDNSEVAEATYIIFAGADVVLDFTSNTEWQFPTSKTVSQDSYTAGGYTVKVAGSSENGYYFDSSNSNLLVGKSGAYITLPTLDFPVSKVVCVGVESGSSKVTFNLYDGDEAVSSPVTSCQIDQTFNIDEGLQESNKTYTLRITNANNARFAKIKIYRGVEAAVKKPTISGSTHFLTSTTVTLDCETDGATIYYTTDGTDPKTSDTKKVYSDPFDLNATTTITVRAKKGDDWSAAVSKNFVKETLMTVAEAKTAVDAGGDLTNKFVKGIISQIDSYNSSYHSITYWISDDGTTTNQLQVYGGLAGVVKTQFEAITDIKVGEEVVVTGTLKKFSSTYEFDKDNTIVAYRPFSPIAWSENPFVAVFGGSNTFPTLNNATGLTITYASSDPSKASFADASVYDITLNAETGDDPITITATSAATDNYVQTSVSYSLTVAASVTYYSLSYEKNGGVSDATDLDQTTNIPATLPTITKAGFNFGGWFTTSDFQAATKVSGGEELTENTTLYAQWLNPYTVGEALTLIAALADNESTDAVYVAGVVTNDALTLESGNTATYIIKDAGETNSLTVYKAKGKKTNEAPEGEDITATDYLQEDDALIIYGQLKKYVNKSGTTPEVVSSYIFSLNRPIVAMQGVSLPATANVRADKKITLTPTFNPTNATNKNVTWSVTAGSDYADVDANGVVTGKAQGTATIQVETEDGGFTATCEVTITPAAPTFTEDDHEWIKVTNDTKLVAGRYYVIASDEKDKVAGTTLTGGYLADVTASFNNGVIAYNGFGSSRTAIAGGAAVFELGGETGAWTLTEVSEEKVLTGATTQNLAWNGAINRTWAITISDGVATIGDASGYYIRHNYGSNRFKPYTGTQSSMKVPQLYMWAELSHLVTFDANGGKAESVPNAERTDEGKIIIPATTPTHTDAAKVFAGWYVTTAPTTLYKVGDEFSTNVDVTLYAKWNSVPTHTVTYVPGGTGTGIPAVTSYAEGVKVKIANVENLANPGYLFTGWVVKDADQNTIDVDENNEFIMPTSNVTIIAGWERQSTQKWARVKYGDILEINTEYVIACTSKSVALGSINTSGSTHYGNSVEVSINGEILKGSSAMVAFTLVAGNADDSYAFQNGSNYLTWSSGNSLDEKSTLDNSSSWTIEVDENNVAAIANVGTSTRALKYNSGSPRFACYTSGQTAIALYKKVLSATVTTTDATETSIPDNADIIVKDGGVLTINNEKTIGDLTIENGGKVVLKEKKLTVIGVFSIETTMASGESGQLNGATATNFVASEAFIDITLGKGGTSKQWHAFTVPFPVDALNGIYDLADNKLINEKNYAIMEYFGDIRAQGKYGWKKIRTTLVPGTFYIMATDGERTTYRFKMKAGSALVAANTKELKEYPLNGGTDERHDNGWNGVGNPTLHYGTADQIVQVLNPNTYTYEEFLVGAKNFVVGTPFFVQAAADGTMTFGAEDNTKQYYAPARYISEEIKDVEVRFGNDEYTDRLYISANEDATNTYETGKDLVKMTMTNTPTVAQIFGFAYNSKLCIVNAPLRNDQAIYALTLYAPTDGEYTIAIPQVENADIFLTYDNRIIWNIAASEYTCDLKAGETTNYGLILRKKAPEVTTTVENANLINGTNTVQKIILNDHVYILRGEKLYDVTGKMVK